MGSWKKAWTTMQIADSETPIVVNGKIYTDHNNATHEFIRWAFRFRFYDPQMSNYIYKQIADWYYREIGRHVSHQLVSRNLNWMMIDCIFDKCKDEE